MVSTVPGAGFSDYNKERKWADIPHCFLTSHSMCPAASLLLPHLPTLIDCTLEPWAKNNSSLAFVTHLIIASRNITEMPDVIEKFLLLSMEWGCKHSHDLVLSPLWFFPVLGTCQAWCETSSSYLQRGFRLLLGLCWIYKVRCWLQMPLMVRAVESWSRGWWSWGHQDRRACLWTK